MLTEQQYQLLQALSDGAFHSGESLASAAGCSRSAIWKRLQKMQASLNLPIDAVTGKGYRLQQPLDLLNRADIIDATGNKMGDALAQVEVHSQIGSTNTRAKSLTLNATQNAALIAAEHQLAGRGRRDRQWISPFGCNLSFSVARFFELPMAALSGLSLAAGVVIAEHLTSLGVSDVGLKWPNDVYWQSGKLGGILVEAQGEADGPVMAIIGIGLNLVSRPEMAAAIDQRYSSLQEAGVAVKRSVLIGSLARALLDMCHEYSLNGLAPWGRRWAKFDIHRGMRVRLSGPAGSVEGVSQGIAEDGGLMLQTENGLKIFHSGELSLRTVDP